jgi:hypothetical protein
VVVPVLVEAQTPAFTPAVPAEELTLTVQPLDRAKQDREILEDKEPVVPANLMVVVVVVVQAQPDQT